MRFDNERVEYEAFKESVKVKLEAITHRMISFIVLYEASRLPLEESLGEKGVSGLIAFRYITTSL